ncbi:MAG: hypothetical protein FRX49_08318 [Trebouxia sp. A1-2]|nr:MAG: hypothetical protein FRX49_08318 [Trebouxia sp. A1-2]
MPGVGLTAQKVGSLVQSHLPGSCLRVLKDEVKITSRHGSLSDAAPFASSKGLWLVKLAESLDIATKVQILV